ncbi:uncharacterized protein PHACADRAFT_246926 [Phanerochaete carnosa HHB-10118-sp]|uniref:Uncharacterized protein n=1 Tax=Phanerochaete carnosa (strain HHB-10118-sp) TaxID=650164 RepID=K5XCU2_PHACS|nr:uncharacterized protein PHACADRAFT_246926 [Phanerochaete carnosa HHB-10118-sp]EKM60792.1 hypothetical protein PHACADRAFT_246926 [Phanerochaete carnosa HHB-10118-sp]
MWGHGGLCRVQLRCAACASVMISMLSSLAARISLLLWLRRAPSSYLQPSSEHNINPHCAM